ncbi:outer membrane beta-barrel protein [Flavobacterium procerum]|uniref:Outer membrane beta-barrel protein n=1 Tax=Flavobacterium procerum TaxID=1455569 RepID=A0ABV6BU78_9FLAO
MKKLVFLFALLITTIASAQKNSLLVGGNVGFSSEKIGDSKLSDFELSPLVGYQFSEKWTAGLQGSIMNAKVTGLENNEKYKVGGFVRYSVSLSELFSFYGDFGVGYQKTSLNNAKGIYAGFEPGVYMDIKNGFCLNFSIGGINYDNLNGKNDLRQNHIGFDFGKTLNIGISKNFVL